MLIRMGDTIQFRDRREAGRVLAGSLRKYADRRDVMVLGLPRGGVPVAFEVASALQVPLDVFIVRKLGVPGFEELAMGAIASGGARVINNAVLSQVPNAEEALRVATEIEVREMERREAEYRGAREPLELAGKTVILVDDGLATGATMRAATKALRQHKVARCVVAVPVAPPDTCAYLEDEVDEIICLATPAHFRAVGQFYDDFTQTSDQDVRNLLADAARYGNSRYGEPS
jgi:putative phosphoribosyl transferase